MRTTKVPREATHSDSSVVREQLKYTSRNFFFFFSVAKRSGSFSFCLSGRRGFSKCLLPEHAKYTENESKYSILFCSFCCLFSTKTNKAAAMRMKLETPFTIVNFKKLFMHEKRELNILLYLFWFSKNEFKKRL